jgi:DNA-binding GntR family transcriptional regulator
MVHDREPRGSGLAEKAYLHVKTQLLEGRHRTDEWVPIDEIAAELGVSRQPVMDAMKRLSSEGFIDIVPQVGSRVRRHSRGEIRDFYRFFAAAEALVAELAATRASPSDIMHLRLISAQISGLFKLATEDTERGRLYRSLNRRLHGEMRRMIRSPTLAEIVESLGDRSDFYIAGAREPVFSPGLVEAHAEHEEIIEAIAAGKPDRARRAMDAHIRSTERRLARRLEAEPEVDPAPVRNTRTSAAASDHAPK